MKEGSVGKYADIIGLPHHTSQTHPRMSMMDRAAQFSPFAALTGYDAVISETSRLTGSRVELDESEKQVLDAEFRSLRSMNAPEITVTFFREDARKAGGEYVCHRGKLKRIDETGRRMVFSDGLAVSLDDVAALSLNEEDDDDDDDEEEEEEGFRP